MIHGFLRRATAIVVCCLGSSVVDAQQPMPPTPPNPLTREMRTAVVDSVAAQLVRFYAVADTGRLIAEHLRRRSRAGAYDSITNPTLFTEAVSRDMKAINGDRHLALLMPQPGPALPLGADRLPRMNFTEPPPAPPALVEGERLNNFQLGKVEVLPGNIGYFEIKAFSQVREARQPVVDALEFLRNTDAIIIDVRDHFGGSADLSNFLISHFTGPDSVHVLDVSIRAADQQWSRWTLTSVPGPKRPSVPVYVLVSRNTVSAGEDFAFVMRNIGRAKLVGEPTAGAGRNNPRFQAGYGFLASISVSTVKDPKTGAEWEGVGVQPHVAVPPRTALSVAHAMALDSLAPQSANPNRKAQLERLREAVEAERKGHVVPRATLERYVGAYGQRVVTLEKDKLIFRLNDRVLGNVLVPLSDTLFALGAQRYAFGRGANGRPELTLIPVVGPPLTFARTGPPPAIRSEY